MSSFTTLALTAIILFVKSSTDILASVSKLDNILKVSVFQRYKKNPKDKELDNSIEFSVHNESQLGKNAVSMTSADYNNHSLFNSQEQSLVPFSQLNHRNSKNQ